MRDDGASGRRWLVVSVIAENEFEVLSQLTEKHIRLLQVFPDAVPIEAASVLVTPLVFAPRMLPPDERWYGGHLS